VPHGFIFLLLERVNPEHNYLAWQLALFAEGAMMRSYGSKDGHRCTLTPLSYPSLARDLPLIRDPAPAIAAWLQAC
jgi:hypothetical protein